MPMPLFATAGQKRKHLHKSFAHFVGQQDAILRVKSFINTYYDEQRPFNMLLAGARSAGKTSMSKATAEAMDIPFIDTDANCITNADSIAAMMMEKLLHLGITPKFDEKSTTFFLPALLFFIDEVQELNKSAQGSLLRATERNDAVLMTRSGNNFDCRKVIWAAATTNPEALVDTLLSRFRLVECRAYSVAEVIEMITHVYPKWPLDVCIRIVYYAGTFPRIAKAFAEEVYDLAKLERISLAEAVECLAQMSHFDEWGMHERTKKCLELLQHHPEGMILRELAQQLGVDAKSILKNQMPPLMRVGESHTALVIHDSRYYITPEGEHYLLEPWPLNMD